MDVRVLASSSRGNAILLRADGASLLVECGLRFQALRRALGFQLSALAGCVVSHEHADHSRAAPELLRAGVDVYASQGTIDALGLSGHRVRPVKALEPFAVGPWRVLPFDTVHDAAEPLGFLVAGAGSKVLYLADTAYSPYRFRGLTHLLIECNYAADLLRANVASGQTPVAHQQRVLRSHLGLERVLAFLGAIDRTALQEIHLLHLSDGNSDAARFKRAIAEATGKPVYVAEGA